MKTLWFLSLVLKPSIFGLAALALLLGRGPAATADSIAFDFTGGKPHIFDPSASFTAGYTFNVNSPIQVTQLGVWDLSPTNPLERNHPVGIWDASGTLLGSATVLTSSPLTSSFRFVPVSPFELDPGPTYTIGAFYLSMGASLGADQPLQSSATGFVQAPQVNFGTERLDFSNAGLIRPTFHSLGNDPGDFGPNFQFQAVAVPESGTLALLGIGAAGLAGYAYRRRKPATAEPWGRTTSGWPWQRFTSVLLGLPVAVHGDSYDSDYVQTP
jgi:hypothetical protein